MRCLARSLALACLAAPLSAQTGTIAGRVTDDGTGRPIAGATVRVSAPERAPTGAQTADDGTYRVANLPAGRYVVTISRIGYALKRFADVEVTAGGTATVNAALGEVATTLTSVVTTASRKPEKALDAPAQISIVTSERIAERPALTATDHLQNQPGVQINQGGIVQANIVARGFNNAFSGSMLMLQDYRFAGVPSLRVNVPFLFTGTSEDIERIEVLLGPASALYGPNSANGVLHLITKSPFSSKGTTLTLDGGERSILRGGFRHAMANGRNTAGFKLSGEYMRGNDWQYADAAEPRQFPPNAPAGRRGLANARDFNVERFTGEARADFRPREGMELVTTYGFTRVGSAIELTGANGAAQIRGWTYQNLQQRFRWNRFFAQAFTNISDAGNANGQSTEGTFLLRNGQPIVDQSRVVVGQVQHGFGLGRKVDILYGGDYIFTNPRTGNTINGRNEDRDNVTEWGGYVQGTWDISNKLQFLGAARVDGNNVVEGTQFSPRAALIFKPTSTQNLRLTYNRAFNTPANFTFFLDLVQARNVAGSGYDIFAQGNPPRSGFTFNRSCAGQSQFGNFCMQSPLVAGGAFTPASAAAAYPALVAAQRAALTAGLGTGVNLGIAALAQQLGQQLPAPLVQQIVAQLQQNLTGNIVTGLVNARPTNTDLSTRVAYLTSGTVNLRPEQLVDIQPLTASFNNTFEIGYKGIVGNRFRYDASFWYQQRGDIATPASIATPSVFFGNPQQLGGFVGANMGATIGQTVAQTLIQNGVPAAVAQATALAFAGQLAPQLAGGLTPLLAAAPLGVIQFNGGFPANQINFAYIQSANAKQVHVSGLDLAADLGVTDRLTIEGTASWMSRNVFPGVPGGNNLDLMANSPTLRFTVGGRWNDERRGFTAELRTRFWNAYPVNSAVFISNYAFAIPQGSPGAVTNPDPRRAGAGQCAPPAAGFFCYDDVPEATLFDATIAKRFDLGGKKFLWSITGTNLADNRVNTFPGVAPIGRMVMTRLQYSF